MGNNALQVFALNSSQQFGDNVCKVLGITRSEHEERDFEDGEHKIRPLENVRGADVFVINSLYGDDVQSVNDKLIRMLFLLGALRDASAARITAVAPYLCYGRKDRKTQSRDPISTRYIAQLFEAIGVDRMLTLDVHNLAAYQNAFRCTTDHLEAKKLFVQHFASLLKGNKLLQGKLLQDKDIVVASPDVGGIKRAEEFRRALQSVLQSELGSAFMEKRRSGGIVSGSAVVGDVEGKVVLMIDDLIASGSTLRRMAEACTQRGAVLTIAAASHGVFTPAANDKLDSNALNTIAITDTVPPFRVTNPQLRERLTVLNAAPLFAEAIKRIHHGGSLVELMSL